MSRVGKKLIKIPKGVTIALNGNTISVKGKHGNLEQDFKNIVNINLTDTELSINRINEEKFTKSYHGLIRALVQNMVTGVDELFSKTLVLEGVGYKFQVNGKTLVLSAGFSHTIDFAIPDDLQVKLESPTKIIISGINKEKVGFFASKIREKRPPEPYKGKGILFEGERILRKAGKTGR
jgi:large subunit ribosomal protein L6